MKNLKSKIKMIFKIIVFLIMVAGFCNWDSRIYIPILVLILFIYSNDKRLSLLENKVEDKVDNPKDTAGFTNIISFHFELSEYFFEKHKNKLGLDDEALAKMNDLMPSVTIKIERYRQGFTRIKEWYYWSNGNKESYVESDDLSPHWLPHIIWCIKFSDCIPKLKNMFKGERMELSFNNTGFLLYLKGGIFEKDPLTKFLGDYRSEPLKENILFSLKVNDFKGIEKYHLLNNEIYRDATCSYFYTPIEEHRTYENSTLKEASEKGIFWKLDWFDFTGKILPKLKYEGSKYVVDLDSVNTSVNTIE